MLKKLTWLLLSLAIALPSEAAKLSAKPVKLYPGKSAVVRVSAIQGSPTFSSSDPGVLQIEQVSSKSKSAKIKVKGVSAGTATLLATDTTGTQSLAFTVLPPMTVSPTSASVAVGGKGTFTISNPAGTKIELKFESSYIYATRSGNTITVTGRKVITNTPLTIYDGKTSITVYVTVTNNTPTSGMSGRLLASNCFQCHGTNGSGGFDQLAGKSSSELYSELKKFASGLENSDGIMAAHAMGYTDAQLLAIADYFASLQ